MKKFLVAFLVIISVKAYAQSPAKSIYFELVGPGIAAVNFDMRFAKSESGIGGRIGLGGFSVGSGTEKATAVFIPVGLNYLLGKDGRHYFELGGGATFVSSRDQVGGNFSSTFGHLNFGYGLQPTEGGFLFRAAITPVFG